MIPDVVVSGKLNAKQPRGIVEARPPPTRSQWLFATRTGAVYPSHQICAFNTLVIQLLSNQLVVCLGVMATVHYLAS